LDNGSRSYAPGVEPPPSSPAGLADQLEAWSERLGGDLLVILDQFEEYFLYHGHESGDGTFAVEFPQAVNREGLHANFLVSIREDSLAKLDRWKGTSRPSGTTSSASSI
jgi:hypothetical protein